MNPATLIAKKRDGSELSSDEIGRLIAGFVAGDVADYQMSAMAMAIYIRGMTVAETAALTEHMLHSGATFSWPGLDRPIVDKHSTGGLGDKVSLILAPMLACCGLAVPMISGRGLGATGGTLDKLEAIPGFRTDLSMDEMQRVVEDVGCVISGATSDLVPADRRLYALRDVTATVPSIPLITASIMSKKLAEGLDALVLDVKWGSGAFMKSLDDARQLAQSLVNTGDRMGVATTALITDMNQPLGRMVGNTVEVNEALDALAGAGPADLREVTVALGVEALRSAAAASVPGASDSDASIPGASDPDASTLGASDPDAASEPNASDRDAASVPVALGAQARERLEQTIDSGEALAKFRAMVAAQGGDIDALRPVATAAVIAAERAGQIASIDAELLGLAVIELGGGRKQQGDKLDLSVGLEILVRLGDTVEAGQPIVRLFARPKGASVEAMLEGAIRIDDEPVEPPLLIQERVEPNG